MVLSLLFPNLIAKYSYRFNHRKRASEQIHEETKSRYLSAHSQQTNISSENRIFTCVHCNMIEARSLLLFTSNTASIMRYRCVSSSKGRTHTIACPSIAANLVIPAAGAHNTRSTHLNTTSKCG